MPAEHTLLFLADTQHFICIAQKSNAFFLKQGQFISESAEFLNQYDSLGPFPCALINPFCSAQKSFSPEFVELSGSMQDCQKLIPCFSGFLYYTRHRHKKRMPAGRKSFCQFQPARSESHELL